MMQTAYEATFDLKYSRTQPNLYVTYKPHIINYKKKFTSDP